jgi:hypothetical protein
MGQRTRPRPAALTVFASLGPDSAEELLTIPSKTFKGFVPNDQE